MIDRRLANLEKARDILNQAVTLVTIRRSIRLRVPIVRFG